MCLGSGLSFYQEKAVSATRSTGPTVGTQSKSVELTFGKRLGPGLRLWRKKKQEIPCDGVLLVSPIPHDLFHDALQETFVVGDDLRLAL